MRPFRTAATTAALFLLLLCALGVAALPGPAHAQETGASSLPDGVVARVHSRDVTEADLLDRIARTYEHGERGRGALAELVDDICVANEAKRRKVSVSDAEVRAYIAKWDETIRKQSGGKAKLEDLYTEGDEEVEFVATAHEFVLRQKMAREDLGSKPDEELSEHYLKMWLASLRRKAKVRYKDLPDGVLAQVGDRSVLRHELAARLRDKLPKEMVAAVGNELVITLFSEHDTAAAGVVVSDEVMGEALRELRKQFASDPQISGSGVTFDQFLRQSRGYGEDDLRQDRVFRARIALRQMIRDEISDADVRTFWEEHRDAYGERVLVRQLLVAASASGAKFQQRDFGQAFQEALGLKVEILVEGGLNLPESERPKTPVAPLLTRVAKKHAHNDEARRKAGEPMIFTKQPLEGEDDLRKAVFEGPLGGLQGPIKSSLGYHLVVVEERRPAPEFDDVKERIRDDLLKDRVNRYELRCRADTTNAVRSWETATDAE
jgi:hypothetical protein